MAVADAASRGFRGRRRASTVRAIGGQLHLDADHVVQAHVAIHGISSSGRPHRAGSWGAVLGDGRETS